MAASVQYSYAKAKLTTTSGLDPLSVAALEATQLPPIASGIIFLLVLLALHLGFVWSLHHQQGWHGRLHAAKGGHEASFREVYHWFLSLPDMAQHHAQHGGSSLEPVAPGRKRTNPAESEQHIYAAAGDGEDRRLADGGAWRGAGRWGLKQLVVEAEETSVYFEGVAGWSWMRRELSLHSEYAAGLERCCATTHKATYDAQVTPSGPPGDEDNDAVTPSRRLDSALHEEGMRPGTPVVPFEALHGLVSL